MSLDKTPSPWEREVLQAWGRRVRSQARRVWYPQRAGLEDEDVVSELEQAVLLACRRFPAYGGGDSRPTDAFVAHFVVLAVFGLIRRTRRPVAQSLTRDDGFDGDLELQIADETTPDPQEQALNEERQQVLQGLTYAVRRNLSPAAFAVLHLRFFEEMTPSEIAQLLGGGDRVVSKLESAKAVAAQFLGSLGVKRLDQLEGVALEDFDAYELD